MKARHEILIQCMVPVVVFALCGMPELLQAQEAAPAPQQSQQTGTTIDPSKGPLQPIPTQTQPEGPRTVYPGQDTDFTQNPQPATPPPQTLAEPQQEPLGAATAEGVETVGGGASRPAGVAIAPAKQNQRRSLLLKLGAIAAVGVAGGTIYALSKGTSAKP
jgi:hypothetical protein